MSLLNRMLERVFHGETGLATRDWAPPQNDRLQPPPYERTAMAPPSDVALILSLRAQRKGVGDEWRRSLAGLISLLDLEDSPQARRDLAAELNLDAGEPGTPKHDAALYEALMQRLGDNGAVAPESFYK